MDKTSALEPGTYPGPFTMQKVQYGTCAECGRAVCFPHECPPFYAVRLGYVELKLRAVSAEEAAELFAQSYDERTGGSKPYFVSTGPVRVSVTDEAGRVTWWEVRGKMVPEYIAQEVKEG